VHHKLGFGDSATVWLAKDIQYYTPSSGTTHSN
jgi:hypothetical protein